MVLICETWVKWNLDGSGDIVAAPMIWDIVGSDYIVFSDGFICC